MSFLKRNRNPDSDQMEADDHDSNVDPDLRLRTVRTAASTIAESIASEQRAERRRSTRHKRSRFFRSKSAKYQDHEKAPSSSSNAPTVQITGKRRNVYVNMPLIATEVDRLGEPIIRYARNKVNTTSELRLKFFITFFSRFLEYTIITFVPKNLYEQFRR
jgi:phospholipid-translocating ATPase